LRNSRHDSSCHRGATWLVYFVVSLQKLAPATSLDICTIAGLCILSDETNIRFQLYVRATGLCVPIYNEEYSGALTVNNNLDAQLKKKLCSTNSRRVALFRGLGERLLEGLYNSSQIRTIVRKLNRFISIPTPQEFHLKNCKIDSIIIMKIFLTYLLVLNLALGALGDDPSDNLVSASIASHHRHLRRNPTSAGLGFDNRKKGAGYKRFPRSDPVTSETPSMLTFCTSNKDCDATSYCAAGQCLPMGSCETDMDCRNPSNSYPVIECTGPLTCSDDKQCGRECGPDCDDGSFPTDQSCDVVPCEVAEEICVSTGAIASCQNDYCTGCNALVFDAAGKHELCIGPVEAESTPCNSTMDCATDGSEYCSQGTCTASGECTTDADCFNPENIFPVIACVGPLSCSDDGHCGKTCSDSDCPVTVDDVSPECSPIACDAMEASYGENFTSCVGYSCGDCQSFVFDQAGHAIFQEEPRNAAATACESSSDCASSQYCQQGLCAEAGQCITDADCYNPENQYAVVLCIGPLVCSADGQCGRSCADNFCPPDKPPVECMVSPCDVLPSSCSEEVSSCVDYYCGGCDFLAFDKAGNQLCHAE
jgi:hypothetical protein